MSSNDRTFVPGMESQGATPNPYAPMESVSNRQPANGTYVPGMQPAAEAASAPVASAPAPSAPSAPIVGFLYSISNSGITEYWPIHLGANIIGRGSNVDVSLNEATVSSRHAQINVKQMRQSHKLIANIQDIGSKCGMFLNDEELDYETHPCKNGDVITVGEAYKLLIVLIDTEALGLQASPNFIPVEVEPVQKEETALPDFSRSSARINNPYDYNGTVDLSGASSPFEAAGGTMILEK